MNRLLNPQELAEVLNVKPGTVFSWLSRMKKNSKIDLPPFIKIAGSTRWRESTVMTWIEAKEKARRKKNFEE